MALAAATVWEVRTAGADTQGGGFVTGASGSDYSQTDTARSGGDVTNISTADAVANGTTTITSATANFTAAIVGNIVPFDGGSGTITRVWRQVTAFTNSTTITIDATIAASTGMTMKIGGAMVSPGCAGLSHTAGNQIWVKSGTYTLTSASTNVVGGCVSLAAAASDTAITTIRGYGSTRGDLGTKPILRADGVITNFTIVTASTKDLVENLELDGNSRSTSAGGLSAGSFGTIFRKCKFLNFTAIALSAAGSARTRAEFCEATACTSGSGTFLISSIGCNIHDCTGPAFVSNAQGQWFVDCIADTNTGASTDGFRSNELGTLFANCVAYGSGRDGFRLNSSGCNMLVINCIAESNTGTGFNAGSGFDVVPFLENCAAYSNGTDYGTNITSTQRIGCITLTGTAFVDAANANFGLNTTVGGAACRAAGLPGVYPGGTTTSYLDIGAAQHADPAATGGGSPNLLGGIHQ